MHGDGRRRWWAALVVLGLILVAGNVIGYLSYNAGVAHGIAISASAGDVEQGAQVAVHSRYYGYGWHPWGFGGFLGPLMFVFLWVFVARMLFWRRRWGHYGYGRYGYGPGYGPGCGPRGFWGPGWGRRGRGRWDRYDRDDRYDPDPDDDRPRDPRDPRDDRPRHML